MGSQKWINEGGIFYPIIGEIVLHTTPGPGIWQVYQNQAMNDKRLGLIRIDDKFTFDYKIYNFGGQDMFEKIEKVWNSETFLEGNRNLGVIYNGTKGTGKTVSAKLLCNAMKMPVIIVNHSYDGLILDFIQSLEFECTIFIDEAEKTFTDNEQEVLLKMIDGVYNKSRKLYILTTNKLSVNENLISRPGRIRYVQQFKNLPSEAVNMYVEDNLIDKSKKQEVLDQVDLLEISTIDILRALVEEVNILGGIDEKSNLNIPRAKYTYDILRLGGCEKDDIPAIRKFIKENKPEGVTLYDWLAKEEEVKDDEGDIFARENYRRFTEEIENCEYSYLYKVSTSSSTFYHGCELNIGTVVQTQDDLGPDFFMIEDYSGDSELCMFVRSRAKPSLYNGRLTYGYGTIL